MPQSLGFKVWHKTFHLNVVQFDQLTVLVYIARLIRDYNEQKGTLLGTPIIHCNCYPHPNMDQRHENNNVLADVRSVWVRIMISFIMQWIIVTTHVFYIATPQPYTHTYLPLAKQWLCIYDICITKYSITFCTYLSFALSVFNSSYLLRSQIIWRHVPVKRRRIMNLNWGSTTWTQLSIGHGDHLWWCWWAVSCLHDIKFLDRPSHNLVSSQSSEEWGEAG